MIPRHDPACAKLRRSTFYTFVAAGIRQGDIIYAKRIRQKERTPLRTGAGWKMALTRKMLKEMSLTEKQIDLIVNAHYETVEALKKYKADSERLLSVESELDAAKQQLAEDYKSKYESLFSEFEEYKRTASCESMKMKKLSGLDKLLRECGVERSCIDPIKRVFDLGSIELDENGGFLNSDELAAGIQRDWAAFIPERKTVGAQTANPPVNSYPKVFSAEDIKRMSYEEINQNYQAIKKSLGAERT